MALNRPTLPNIIDRVATDIEAALVGTDARLRRANTTVLGRAIAGTTHGLYGFAEQQANQYIITSATGGILERWAAVWKIARKAATSASGTAVIAGIAGTVLPAGSVLSRSDSAEFTTREDAEARKPVTAEVYVFAPLRYTVDFTISVTPNTEAVRAAVRAELEDLFAREAEPETPIFKTHYDEAISAADGETDHLVTVPVGNIQPSAGAIPALGVITWV